MQFSPRLLLQALLRSNLSYPQRFSVGKREKLFHRLSPVTQSSEQQWKKLYKLKLPMRSLKVSDSMALCFLEVIFILTARVHCFVSILKSLFSLLRYFMLLGRRSSFSCRSCDFQNKSKLKYLSPWTAERVREWKVMIVCSGCAYGKHTENYWKTA